MPSLAAPQRRQLDTASLCRAFAASKPTALSDAPAPATTSSGRPLHRQAPPTSTSAAGVRSLAWSPTGSLLAVADARALRVWNPDKPQLRFSTELKPAAAAPSRPQPPTPQHLLGTERVAWNPAREAELASVGADGVVRFWDVRSRGACVGEVRVGGEGLSLAWRPGGEELVVGRKDDVLVTISRASLSIQSEHPQSVQTNQIAFSNGGAELFLTTGDSQVKILDYPSMTTLHTITPHTSSVTCCAPCPRGRHLAIGGSDALVTLWATADLTCRRSIADITGPVRSVSFSFDGVYVVAGSDERNEGAPGNVATPAPADGAGGASAGARADAPGATSGLSVYAVESGECVYTIETPAATQCVEWHPSRYLLAYSGESSGVKIVGTSTLG